MRNTLMTPSEAAALVAEGRLLMIAGNEQLLAQIGKGHWIGGTIPYFMGEDGGCEDFEHVFVTDFTDVVTNFSIKAYAAPELGQMLTDRYSDGFSYILLPAFSEPHSDYALKVRYMDNLFDVPTMGWVTGVHISEIGTKKPKVINGETGEVLDNECIAMHMQLPADKLAGIEIVNIYAQSDSVEFSFPHDSFTVSDCLINGKAGNLADYLVVNNVDLSLPLVADHGGALINADIQNVDKEARTVSFFAPILSTQEYKIAEPIADRYAAFLDTMPEDNSQVICSCNCLSSYLQLGLNGKHTKGVTSPFTFGEIAYILVNQTMVMLSLYDKKEEL